MKPICIYFPSMRKEMRLQNMEKNNRHSTSDPSNMKLVSLDSALKQERNRIGIPST